MDTNELRELLILRGVTCRIRGDEVCLQVCPQCGNARWNLELCPARGVYHCWACNRGGALARWLREEAGLVIEIPVVGVGDRPRGLVPVSATATSPSVQPLTSAACSYLCTRGLSAAEQIQYGWAEGVEPPWKHRAVVPLHDYWTHRVVGWMGRAIHHAIRPPYYAQWTDGGQRHIVGYAGRHRPEVHVVVEGIFDCLRVHQAGYSAAALLGTSAPGVEEWAVRVPRNDHVAILLDATATAEASKLYWRVLPLHDRTYPPLVLPAADPASYPADILGSWITAQLAHYVHTTHPPEDISPCWSTVKS